jgi:hypothetical protein
MTDQTQDKIRTCFNNLLDEFNETLKSKIGISVDKNPYLLSLEMITVIPINQPFEKYDDGFINLLMSSYITISTEFIEDYFWFHDVMINI